MAKDVTTVAGAVTPNGEAAPKRKRSTGPRERKPTQAIMLYKGTLDSFEIVFDPFVALDRKEADSALQIKKFEVPLKNKPKAPASAA